ncbi:MAG: hypothetical protein AAGD34_08535 [Pseudomonadota bacterium]
MMDGGGVGLTDPHTMDDLDGEPLPDRLPSSVLTSDFTDPLDNPGAPDDWFCLTGRPCGEAVRATGRP